MNIRISLVIPVYNEAESIDDCLQTIAQQTVQPYEVIVVDNNSTDDTVAIARSYPWVSVITEHRQGVVYARDAGFNAARGDVIGRIDADSRPAADWIERLQTLFAAPGVDVVTGRVTVHSVCAAKLVSRIDLACRRHVNRRIGDGHIALQGANMALKRSVWQSIKPDLCYESGIHEDYDLGIHAAERGFTLSFDEDLVAAIRHRQMDSGFRRFMAYALVSPRTYVQHGVRRGKVMYRIIALVVSLYPLVVVLSRGYNESSGRFSFIKLFLQPSVRVNPATYLD